MGCSRMRPQEQATELYPCFKMPFVKRRNDLKASQIAFITFSLLHMLNKTAFPKHAFVINGDCKPVMAHSGAGRRFQTRRRIQDSELPLKRDNLLLCRC